MMNLLMKRQAWLRAARMLAVCFVMMGAVMAASPVAQAQSTRCGCTITATDQTVTFTVNDCPVTITYDKMICPVNPPPSTIETIQIKKIEFQNTGCCTQFYANTTTAALVQQISAGLISLNVPGVFSTTSNGTNMVRVSRSPCWSRSSNGLILTECASTDCCWIDGVLGYNYTPIPGRSFTVIPNCSPCEFICE